MTFFATKDEKWSNTYSSIYISKFRKPKQISPQKKGLYNFNLTRMCIYVNTRDIKLLGRYATFDIFGGVLEYILSRTLHKVVTRKKLFPYIKFTFFSHDKIIRST